MVQVQVCLGQVEVKVSPALEGHSGRARSAAWGAVGACRAHVVRRRDFVSLCTFEGEGGRVCLFLHSLPRTGDVWHRTCHRQHHWNKFHLRRLGPQAFRRLPRRARAPARPRVRPFMNIIMLGFVSERAKGWGGSLWQSRVRSSSPILLPRVVGQVRLWERAKCANTSAGSRAW